MDLHTSTFDLVSRFQNGEQGAFSLLFRKYQKRLAVLIYYKMSAELRNRVEVDDIMQDVFFAASRDLCRFTYESPGNLMAWLSRIADNSIIDAARHHAREKRNPEELLAFRSESNPHGAEPVSFETPSRIFARQENLELLLRKLDALPTEYREVLLLAKFEGLTTSEIAKSTGKSREAVSLILHRAVKRFRELQSGSQPND